MTALAPALGAMSRTRCLDLSATGIDDDCAYALADALHAMPDLTCLDLSGNRIRSTEALERARARSNHRSHDIHQK